MTLAEHLTGIGCKADYLTGEKLPVSGVAQLLESKGLKGAAEGAVLFAYDDRQPAHFVTGSNNALVCHDEQGHGAVYLFLCVAYAIHKGVLFGYECAYEGRPVDLPAAHYLKADGMGIHDLVPEFLIVVDYPYAAHRIHAQL